MKKILSVATAVFGPTYFILKNGTEPTTVKILNLHHFLMILFILILLSNPFNGFAADPLSAKSGFIEMENGKLFYEMTGVGESIVLVHDGLVHREIWNGQFYEFGKQYRVIRYDRRGYGQSPLPNQPYSNVEDLDAVMRQLKVDSAILMGMSAGGGLCIDYALAHPQKVKMLVLVGAVVSGFDYTQHLLTRGGRLTPAIYADPDKLLNYLLEQDPYEIGSADQTIRAKLRQLMEANPNSLNPAKNRYLRPPERTALSHLSEITVPALIIVGDGDIPDVHAHAGAMDAGMPNATRVIISGAGHLVPFENSTAFNEAVLQFLREAPFMILFETQGADAAVKAFDEGRRKDPSYTPFNENRMNQLGYTYLQQKKVEDAIKVLKLNVVAFPDSWNAYDSLAEACMVHGDMDLAKEYYRKSLAINPQNTNAVQKLAELNAK